jgi:hypothetical protein
MKRPAHVTVVLVLGLVASCSGGGGGAKSKINKDSIDKAKKLVAAPQPLADVRPKLVEVLGEPTATVGENLVWAAVSGDECRELTLMVQGGEVKGTTGGMANKMVASEFDKCAAHAAK